MAAVDGRVYALGGQENEGGYKVCIFSTPSFAFAIHALSGSETQDRGRQPEYTDLRSVESLQISPMRGDRCAP